MAVTDTPRPGRVTAEQFLASPDDFPVHSQLVQGQIIVSEPDVYHQRVRDRLHRCIDRWATSHTGRGEVLSPLDVPIDSWNVFAPNVLWFSEARRPARGARRLDSPPDLAVEVRSRSTWRYDLMVKLPRYDGRGYRSCGSSTPRARRCSCTGAPSRPRRSSTRCSSWAKAKR